MSSWGTRTLASLSSSASLRVVVDTPGVNNLLAPGECERVTRSLEQLSSLGIVPGVVLRLLQNQLAAVVRVGETEVAIDFDIARQIYVRPHTFRGSKSGRT